MPPASGPSTEFNSHAHEVPGHGHGVTAEADRRYICLALGLIVAFMVFELIAALVAGRWRCWPTRVTCSPTWER